MDQVIPLHQSTQSTNAYFCAQDYQNNFSDLLDITLAALTTSVPYHHALFGRISSWLPPHRDLSEYALFTPWQAKQALSYLLDIALPAWAHKPGGLARFSLPKPLLRRLWRPSEHFVHPDPFSTTHSFADEKWFFINGIATNKDMATTNAEMLSQLFWRPIHVINNSTQSLALDLYQCALGKSFKTSGDVSQPHTLTEPAYQASLCVLQALQNENYKKIVVLAHSQGTIIMANVLRAIANAYRVCHSKLKHQTPPKTDASTELAIASIAPKKVNCEKALLQAFIDKLKRLECYMFANCADICEYIFLTSGNGPTTGLPYIENFANEGDLVARLGMLSPLRKARNPKVSIHGKDMIKKGKHAFGHLLNQHYLFDIQAYLESPRMRQNPYPDKEGNLSRLYDYHRGQSPNPYCSTP